MLGVSSLQTTYAFNVGLGQLTITLTSLFPATFAFYTGTPTGASTPVTITANVSGTGGNSVVLTFTGSNTIAQAIATWNAANPTNQVTLTTGTGTQVPTVGSVALSGGINANAVLGTIVVEIEKHRAVTEALNLIAEAYTASNDPDAFRHRVLLDQNNNVATTAFE